MPYQAPRTAVGARHERVGLQRRATTSDGMGGTVAATPLGWRPQWVWGHVTALDERTREALLGAGQLTALHSFHVDIAYRTGITPLMRLRWRDKTLEVQSAVDDTGEKKRLLLLCSEVQGVPASA